MGSAVQLLALTTIGAFLLWFGYRLFVGFGGPRAGGVRGPAVDSGLAGAARTCPVCSARLLRGERVKSSAFPSMGGSPDRLMHIFGCPYCLSPDFPRDRVCPVCGKRLSPNAHLVARIFDKPGRSHVHVLGCSSCRGPRSSR